MSPTPILLLADTGDFVAWTAVIISLLAVLVSLLTAFLAFYGDILGHRHTAALEISTKAFEDRLEQLNGFYGPLQAGLQKLADLKKTLLVALNRTQFDPKSSERHDPRLMDIVEDVLAHPRANAILQRIIETQRHLAEEVLTKSGYVRNVELREKIGELIRHFEEFQIAYEEKKSDSSERLTRFPRGLDLLVSAEIDTIQVYLKEHRDNADAYIAQHWTSRLT